MSNKVFINSKTIILKTLTIKEVQNYYYWFNNQDITRNMNKGHFPNSFEKQTRYFKEIKLSGNDIQLGIYKKNINKIIGIISLHNIDFIHRVASISIMLGDLNSVNRGVGSQSIKLLSDHAFKKLNLRKLKAGMWKLNYASRYAFEKNNFKKEAILKKEYEYNGKLIDSLILSKFNI